MNSDSQKPKLDDGISQREDSLLLDILLLDTLRKVTHLAGAMRVEGAMGPAILPLLRAATTLHSSRSCTYSSRKSKEEWGKASATAGESGDDR